MKDNLLEIVLGTAQYLMNFEDGLEKPVLQDWQNPDKFYVNNKKEFTNLRIVSCKHLLNDCSLVPRNRHEPTEPPNLSNLRVAEPLPLEKSWIPTTKHRILCVRIIWNRVQSKTNCPHHLPTRVDTDPEANSVEMVCRTTQTPLRAC